MAIFGGGGGDKPISLRLNWRQGLLQRKPGLVVKAVHFCTSKAIKHILCSIIKAQESLLVRFQLEFSSAL